MIIFPFFIFAHFENDGLALRSHLTPCPLSKGRGGEIAACVPTSPSPLGEGERGGEVRNISYQSLSNRGKHVLGKLGIYAEQQLLQFNLTQEKIFSLKNVGAKTCDEIWSLIEYLRSNDRRETGITESAEIPFEDVLLLGSKISAKVWDILTRLSINQCEWSIRTKKGITKKNCITLANIAEIPPHHWLKIENFGRHSLTELQEKLSSVINDLSQIEKSNSYSLEQFQELPLLTINVPQHVWYALRIIPIADIEWTIRTNNGLIRKNCKTLSDIVMTTKQDWLRLENFGRHSLKELKEKISAVLTVLLDSHTKPSKEIQSLSELSQEILSWLKERQQEVVKLYYGYADSPKTLEEIGTMFDLTRERIRQIRDQANKKLFHKPKRAYLSKMIFELVGKQLLSLLHEKGGMCKVAEVRQLLAERLRWGKQEQWLSNWLNEVFGENWILLGIQDYFFEDGICRANTLAPAQEFVFHLAQLLKQYGYRPITLGNCSKFYERRVKQSVALKELETLCQSHPHLKIYEYEEKYIGRKDWKWFVPETRDSVLKTAGLAEWFLRLTNQPAHAKEIAYGIREKIGHFGVDAVEVIEACEDKPEQFFSDEEDRYHLVMWKEAVTYKHAITEIVYAQATPLQQIMQKLSPVNPAAVIAALHLHEEFIEIRPFEWTVKRPENLVDLANLTFEDFIPR